MPNPPEERVSTIELFFDLVFVLAVNAFGYAFLAVLAGIVALATGIMGLAITPQAELAALVAIVGSGAFLESRSLRL